MLQRLIEKKLEKAIECFPAVALLGPRQVGKTTSLLEIVRRRDSIYLDLESSEDLLKLRDSVSFLSGNSEKLVVPNSANKRVRSFVALEIAAGVPLRKEWAEFPS